MLQAGFAKVDITPRVGVELCGFGVYRNRHSTAVRDPLYARAMALRDEQTLLIIVSCDLVGLQQALTDPLRERLAKELGTSVGNIMLHCTHTHSGPCTVPDLIGWGDPDTPYLEILPTRLAAAAHHAVEALRPATLHHAEVPCEGMALNREYDQDAPPLEEVLQESWRPAKPELTDTTCHVLRVDDAVSGRCLGHCTYFSCHPVVCCAETTHLHGDFCGVAMTNLERERPGTVGLFLQGAQGDVNSCVVHKPAQEALLALDIIAARFARSVREGLASATPMQATPLAGLDHRCRFSRRETSREALLEKAAEHTAVLHAPDATDDRRDERIAAVFLTALRRLIARLDAGKDLSPTLPLQGMRIGDLLLLASPFEVMQAIKRDVLAGAKGPIPLVMGITNDLGGYAPDRTVAARGGYAADMVPMMLGQLPYANIHDELVKEMLAIDSQLTNDSP